MHEYASKTGVPLSVTPMTISIWIDTIQDTCKPIIGQIHLEFNGASHDENCPINEEKLFTILTFIDKITPIYRIIVEYKGFIHPFKTFIVSKTEEYMNKGCES
jgi:hypothetical protein